MGKCFLGLWGGILFAFSFVVSELSFSRADFSRCISGAWEWIFLGGLLTGIALAGNVLYTVYEQRREK